MPSLALAFVFFGFALLIGLVIAVPVGLVLLIRHRENQRSRPLEQAARGLGLAFAARGGELPLPLQRVHPFDDGFKGKVLNLASGLLAGTEVLVCDYASLEAHGGIANRHTAFSPHQVAALRLRAGARPDLDVPRADARASAFRTEHCEGWLVVSRQGFVPPEAWPGFLSDAARILALASPEQGEPLARAVAQATASRP